MIVLGEPDFYVWLGVTAVLLLYFILTLALAGNYIKARLKKRFGLGEIVLVKQRDGTLIWRNMKKELGFLTDKNEFVKIAADCINRSKDVDFYCMSEGFGLTYNIDLAECVNFLRRNGYMNIVEALRKYDEEYFNPEKNKENYEKLLKAIEQDNMNKTMKVREIKEDARKKLITLKLEWVNDFTIPLAVTYNWALQNVSSTENKIMYDKGYLSAISEEYKSGWTAEKITFLVVMLAGILIVGAIAFYVFTLAGSHNQIQQIPNQIPQTLEVINQTIQ